MNSDSQPCAWLCNKLPESIDAPVTSGFLRSTSARMWRCHALRGILDLNLVSFVHLAAVDRHVDLIPRQQPMTNSVIQHFKRAMFPNFFNVGPSKGIFLTTIYSLNFSRHYTLHYKLHFFKWTSVGSF